MCYQARDAPGDGLDVVKLSISLANGTLVTLEADETGLMHDVLRMVLDSVPPGPVEAEVSAPVQAEWGEVDVEKGTGATPPEGVQNSSSAQRGTNGVNGAAGGQASTNGAQPHPGPAASATTIGEPGDDRLDLGRFSQQSREDFRAFCQPINPTGDMRRVVVAAEAANRFFGIDGINADEVGELFDLIGWRRANSFTQTIRNAARTKFGWMERIPGRSGRYAPTDFGRAMTLSG